MRRSSVVVLAVAAVLSLLVALPALVAQEAGGNAPGGRMGRGPGGAGPGAGPTMQEQMDSALKQAGLNDSERAAAERAVKTKMDARQELTTAFGQLRRTNSDAKATDEQLKQAVDAYGQALTKYRNAVQTEDQNLVKQLSVKSHARCLALGVLDNGLGMGGGMRGGGGGGMRGGMRGDMRGGGGRGMGGGGMGGPPA